MIIFPHDELEIIKINNDEVKNYNTLDHIVLILRIDLDWRQIAGIAQPGQRRKVEGLVT